MVKGLEIRGGLVVRLNPPPFLAWGMGTKQLGMGSVKTNEVDMDVCFF